MIHPNEPVIPFESEDQKLSYLRSWGLVSPKAEKVKQLYYRGLFADDYTPCEVIGRLEKTFIVIQINGEQHCIHPEYLAEMQPTKKELAHLQQE